MRPRLAGLTAACVLASTMIAPAARSEPAPEPVLTFATFNICKSECGKGKWAWPNRKPVIVRNIVASGADVIGVQEAARTVDEIAPLLAAQGYALANSDTRGCGGGCTQDSFIFYRTATVEPARIEIRNPQVPTQCTKYDNSAQPPYPEPVAPRQPVAPVLPADASPEQVQQHAASLAEYNEKLTAWLQYVNDLRQYRAAVSTWWADYERYSCARTATQPRYLDRSEGTSTLTAVTTVNWWGSFNRGWSWAYLRDKRTGGGLLAATVHLPVEKTKQGERLRRASARGLATFLRDDRTRWGLPDLPTFLVADLNSYQRRQPKGAHVVLRTLGFRDAYRAPRKKNAWSPTVNVSGTNRKGFPKKPFRRDKPARIDYVMYNRGTALRYELFLKLKRGYFDNNYRGSDHNLVKATIRFPRVPVAR